MTTTKTYHITSIIGGADLGTWEATSPAEAWRLSARDAGYTIDETGAATVERDADGEPMAALSGVVVEVAADEPEAPTSISIVSVDAEDGMFCVVADVVTAGFSGRTTWYGVPSHTTAGVDGLRAAGDAVDCWVDGAVYAAIGHERTVEIGHEILARVPTQPTDEGLVPVTTEA